MVRQLVFLALGGTPALRHVFSRLDQVNNTTITKTLKNEHVTCQRELIEEVSCKDISALNALVFHIKRLALIKIRS